MANESEFKTDETGGGYLVVYYDPDRRDWDRRIAEAVRRHGVESRTIHIIAKPETGNNDGSKFTERENIAS